jgi:uncharacterized membrane protein YhaH (DUF805 family)
MDIASPTTHKRPILAIVGSKIARLFGFSGRINRSTWWLIQLGAPIVFFGLFLAVAVPLSLVMENSSEPATIKDVYRANSEDSRTDPLTSFDQVLLSCCLLGYWIVYLAANVKRLHDHNNSGLWIFVSVIPVAGAIWLTVVLGFRKGTEGVNRYGEPPR